MFDVLSRMGSMRTTLDIEKALLDQAKRRSRERGCTLGHYVEEILRAALMPRREESRPSSFKLVTFGGDSLQEGVSPRRMKEVLDEEDITRFTGRDAPA